jgi:peptidoglycan/xylan/chitin deacetylase (PgdA/CDA1 family)
VTAGANGTPRASLVLCVDLELAWGWAFKGDLRRWEPRFLRGRAAVPRLLDVLEAAEVPATWATVGHLLLDSCNGKGGRAHTDVVRPDFDWFPHDWFEPDPRGDVRSHPLWYASDLIEDIRRRRPVHEIGSHSFSHLVFGDPGCSRAAAESDLGAAAEAADRIGLRPDVFVYPRHWFGFEDVIADHGFIAFRTDDREPLMRAPAGIRKPARLAARSVGAGLRPQRGEVTRRGLADLPASMFFSLPEGRLGRAITAASLVRAFRRGIRRAVDDGGMFQIYFHDHNMGVRTQEFFEAMGAALALACAARDRGELEIVTLGGYARRVLR